MGIDRIDPRAVARALVADETGTIRKEAPERIALVYPSPYRAAMSSLGYQTIYRLLNNTDLVAADRAVLPDDPEAQRRAGAPLLTLERERPIGDYPLVAFSIAYELELAGLIECLELAGIPVLAEERTADDPLVIAGGPLTFSNPVPLAPFCDVILLGEAEETMPELVDRAAELSYDRAALLAALAARPGFYLPTAHGAAVPAIARAGDEHLPARSQIITANTELRSMYLTETARGCSRGCTYCVMRRSTNGGMRVIDVDAIVAGIPASATRVGLVGAAVTDHPGLDQLLRRIVEGGREVGVSSLRADRLNDEIVALLRAGGYRTLTVALDGASAALRQAIERKHTEADLLRAAQLATRHRLGTLKVYIMIGLPGENESDVDELVRFAHELAAAHRRVELGVAPFVAKRHTPLDGAPYAGIDVIDRRLRQLRRGLKGRVRLRPTSARWAWVEYMLAQGDHNAGHATLAAHRAGGRFAHYKAAFAAHGCRPSGPVARVPSTSELITLRRKPDR